VARVFDLLQELDFAVHPVIGAACVLHALHGSQDSEAWTLRLKARTVRVRDITLDRSTEALQIVTSQLGERAVAVGLAHLVGTGARARGGRSRPVGPGRALRRTDRQRLSPYSDPVLATGSVGMAGGGSFGWERDRQGGADIEDTVDCQGSAVVGDDLAGDGQS
jgi:hypothetical protein